MRVIITGGAGFLGQRLARALLDRAMLTDHRGKQRPIWDLRLVDVVSPPDLENPRVSWVTGDLSDPTLVEQAFEAALENRLGMTADIDFEAIVRQYIGDELRH